MKEIHLCILFILFFFSCKKEEPFYTIGKLDSIQSEKSRGLFVLNEGNFMFGNSSLSYYSINNKEIINDIFFNVNKSPLGDVAQSMIVYGDYAYIAINNSGKVYVINKDNFTYIAKITGLTSPRYVSILNEKKGYISDLYSNEISIFNPSTFEITGKIDIGNKNSQFNQHTSEQMLFYGNKLFVNCWSFDNKILVIDTQQDKIVDSIDVRIQPQNMVIDMNNKLWVLTDGGYQGNLFGYEEPALIKINTTTHQIEKTFVFNNKEDSPGDLCLNGSGDTLFFINSNVYQMAVNSTQLPTNFFIPSLGKLFYAMIIDPVNSDLYVSDAVDYQKSGIIYRYNYKAELLDSFQVGINPGFFCFK